MTFSIDRVNQSLKQKTSARIAAVQCLYRWSLTEDHKDAEALLSEYHSHLTSKDPQDKEFGLPSQPDGKLLKIIVEQTLLHVEMIDPLLRLHLNKSWTFERMSPILIAIARAGICELVYTPTKSPIVIDQYTQLTGRFFSSEETGFINALLQKIADEQPRV